MSNLPKLVRVDANRVFSAWECGREDCPLQGERVYVTAPNWAHSGGPVCEACDANMEFRGIAIRIPDE